MIYLYCPNFCPKVRYTIVEKIDRVLYTYVAEDPKKYLKHSLVLREIYRTLTEVVELLVESKLKGVGKVES